MPTPQQQPILDLSSPFYSRSVSIIPFSVLIAVFSPKVPPSMIENLDRVRKTFSDFTSLNHWVVKEYFRLVDSINASTLSNEQLATKIEEFRLWLGQGEILADTLAVVREAAIRKLGKHNFDVQISVLLWTIDDSHTHTSCDA
ncbi:hypothetical protein RYX36_004742 [Vicia faba]